MSNYRYTEQDGIYHVYNRGINKENILANPEDKNVFLKMFSDSQRIYNFRIYAYSIMRNHYHFLYHDVDLNISNIIGVIQENYAKYYNAKYNRSGPVFSSPFKSKIVRDTNYFFVLACYILNNPIEANLVSKFNEYNWNSEITDFSRLNLVDTQYLKHLFCKYMIGSLEQYILDNSTSNKICEIESYTLKDLEALAIFNDIVRDYTGLNQFNKNEIPTQTINKIIESAYYIGLSVRQISSFTKLSTKLIRCNRGERIYL